LTRGPVRVAIFGASGYTGYELLRLLRGHQGVMISRLFRENPPYGPLETLGGPWAHFQGLYFEAYEESLLEGVDGSLFGAARRKRRAFCVRAP